jgi:hypothetical protein
MEQLSQTIAGNGTTHSMITRDFIAYHGGASLLQKYGSIRKLLKAFVPERATRFPLPLPRNSKAQQLLTDILKQLLKNHYLLCNYRHPDLRFQNACILLQTFIFT